MSLCAAVIADDESIVLSCDSRTMKQNQGRLVVEDDQYQKYYYFQSRNAILLQCGTGYFQQWDGSRQNLQEICNIINEKTNAGALTLNQLFKMVCNAFCRLTNLPGNANVSLMLCGFGNDGTPTILRADILNGELLKTDFETRQRKVATIGINVLEQTGFPLYDDDMVDEREYWQHALDYLVFTFAQVQLDAYKSIGGDVTTIVLSQNAHEPGYYNRPHWA